MLKKGIFAILFGLSVSTYASIDDYIMNLYVGQSEFINDKSITNVAIGSDEIINALPIEDKGVLLTGIKNGDTTIKIWRDDSVQSINAHVHPENLKRMLDEIKFFIHKYPGLKATIVGDTILIDGPDLNEQDKIKLDSFLEQYENVTNITRAKNQIADKNDTRMVYFDVKIVEVTTSASENLGVKWSSQVNGPRVGVVGEFKKSEFYKDGALLDEFDGIPSGDTIRPFQTYAGLISSLSSKINLMQSEGTANLIAHPVLSCRNGGNAEFLSGGQVPYSVTSSLGTPSVEFKDYGIKLSVSPIIKSDGSILASITSEISEIDPGVSVDNVPGLLTRRTETDFSLENGETLVLSGLNYNRQSESKSQVPGLHKTPLLGGLFKDKSTAETKTELLFIVTPFIYSEKDDKSTVLVQNANDMSDLINLNNKLLPQDFFESNDNRIYFYEEVE